MHIASGITFYEGNSAEALEQKGVYDPQVDAMLARAANERGLDGLEADRWFFSLGLAWLKEQALTTPSNLVQLFYFKVIRFWSVAGHTQRWPFVVVSVCSYGLLFPFFWLGAWKSLFSRKNGHTAVRELAWPLAAAVCMLFVNCMIFLSLIRYRSPIEPAIILFGTVGVGAAIERVSRWWKPGRRARHNMA